MSALCVGPVSQHRAMYAQWAFVRTPLRVSLLCLCLLSSFGSPFPSFLSPSTSSSSFLALVYGSLPLPSESLLSLQSSSLVFSPLLPIRPPPHAWLWRLRLALPPVDHSDSLTPGLSVGYACCHEAPKTTRQAGLRPRRQDCCQVFEAVPSILEMQKISPSLDPEIICDILVIPYNLEEALIEHRLNDL